jgi:hypothetical protein
LVTDLHASQALALARKFYRASYDVIDAGYESYCLPISALFSRYVEIFYNLGGRRGKERYVRDLLDIVRKQKAEI